MSSGSTPSRARRGASRADVPERRRWPTSPSADGPIRPSATGNPTRGGFMIRMMGVGILSCLMATLLLAQDRKPPAGDDTKKMGGVLQDVNLHDLTVAV